MGVIKVICGVGGPGRDRRGEWVRHVTHLRVQKEKGDLRWFYGISAGALGGARWRASNATWSPGGGRRGRGASQRSSAPGGIALAIIARALLSARACPRDALLEYFMSCVCRQAQDETVNSRVGVSICRSSVHVERLRDVRTYL